MVPSAKTVWSGGSRSGASTVKKMVVTRRSIRKAFEDLVITDEVLNEIGPAINSAQSIFFFGYPGNGKTSIAERITRLMGDAIYVPHAIEVGGQIIKVFDPVQHTPVGDAEAPDDVSRALLGRRDFLMGLGALALAGCGAGGAGSPATRLLSTGTMSGTGAAITSFVHPGLLHTQADFDRMAAKYTTSPWSGSWNLLINNSHASLSYTPRPQTIVYRGYDGVHPENYSTLFNDVAAAYACALRWKADQGFRS